MFELGSSLREARVRRGIELPQVAAATRIRARYLKALEDERFELMPGEVYAKGFLRAYADYLGLDSQLFVDEYNARFNEEESEPPPQQLELRAPSKRRYHYGVGVVVLLLALGGSLLGWQLSSSSPRPSALPAVPAAAAGAPASSAPRPVRPETTGPVAGPASASLVLRATRGPCWLSVHQGSKSGAQLFQGTLEPGQWRRFSQRPLWVRIGAPWNLEASLAGRRLTLPQAVADVAVTAGGIRTLATM